MQLQQAYLTEQIMTPHPIQIIDSLNQNQSALNDMDFKQTQLVEEREQFAKKYLRLLRLRLIKKKTSHHYNGYAIN